MKNKINKNTTSYKNAILALDGLAIGDAFGEMFSYRPKSAYEAVLNNKMPPKPWWYTDDTEMAIAITEVLVNVGYIKQDLLAQRFAERFAMEPPRSYGKMARNILNKILDGENWETASKNAFSGLGSMGNGGAMRVAPLGAYFSYSLENVRYQAELSATITHSHPEGIAGTIAIAIAAAIALQFSGENKNIVRSNIFDAVLSYTPTGITYNNIIKARKIAPTETIMTATRLLGNGSLVTAQDTVPYVLWCATRHLDDFSKAMIETVSGNGDCDTNCAMVGGIVSLYTGYNGIPDEWLDAKESYQLEIL